MEFDVENDEEHAEKTAPDTHLQKLTGIGHDGRRQEQWDRDLEETFAEGNIFQDRLIGKPTELFEQGTTDEEGLVAVNDAASDTTEIVQERDQLAQRVTSPHIGTYAHIWTDGCRFFPVCLVFQPSLPTNTSIY